LPIRDPALSHSHSIAATRRSSGCVAVAFALATLSLTGCQQHGHVAGGVLGEVAAHVAGRYIERRMEHRGGGEGGGQWSRDDNRSSAGDAPAAGRYAAVFPIVGALPNGTMTPGALNPAVTQETLDQTICRRGGYTRSIRPSEHYTEQLKRKGIREYGYAQAMGHDAARFGNYEEDHLISLELGGSPTSPANLWPEPHHVIGGWGSYAKDRLENTLHTLVCRRQISLAQAQYQISHDWVAAYKQYIGAAPDQSRSHRYGD